MGSALAGTPEISHPQPPGLIQIEAGDGSRSDFQYAEYEAPEPPLAPDWLRQMFASDNSPALEAPEEAIPPMMPRSIPAAQAPAPVEDRMPVPIRR